MSDNVWGSPDPSARRDQPPASGVERSSAAQPPAENTAETPAEVELARPEDIERAQAVKDLKRRRDFAGSVGGWMTVSAISTGVWFATGADGYFWPIWPMLGIGIGVASQAAALWGPEKKDITEADIAAQMRKRELRGR
ncbi:2TM domain-containing protein [Rathayibacter sp. VKM Ac-2857]|uniref:2TM domain-containing protein n=1 Tax=Rathayibacter sp. VKM Ac-2857 TaxID=2739020 RepID=UPI0015655158|nr:2TM domain-containing protein [Rathayibacter sp. VKM Ac-2857]NQX16069.1 2TM domain-containing protein [Rathayibacter sp. VKM Ac-2857]